MRLILKENPNGFEWTLTPEPSLPLCEGKCPPAVDKNGKGYYPRPSKRKDPNVREEEKYSVEDRDEFWDYVTVCKLCGAKFIARDDDYKTIRNFCPGCGERLVTE